MSRQTILVTGSNGFIGSLLVKELLQNSDRLIVGISVGESRVPSHLSFRYWNVDITNKAQIKQVFEKHKPQVVVHCAAISQVDISEKNSNLCNEVNVNATQFLVDESSKINARFIFISSDFVFDGRQQWITNHTKPNPISVYGKSKLAAEEIVKSSIENWAIVRPVLVYGYSKSAARENIFTWVLDSLKNGKDINVVQDQIRTPTFVLDVVKLIKNIIENSANGFFNIGGSEAISVLDFAKQIGNIAREDISKIHSVKSEDINGANLRPMYSCFSNSVLKDRFGFAPNGIKEGIKKALTQIN